MDCKMNKSEILLKKINVLNEIKPIKDPEKILRKAERIGSVVTEKGNLIIWQVIQSRGSSTGFVPKGFRFVQFPNNGDLFTLQKSFIENWKKQGFVIKMFNSEKL